MPFVLPIPPRVEYSLTAHGANFVPILRSMYDWGEIHLEHPKIRYVEK
ncbi:winged helix-turn-helix transcriptional regulator [Paenibacillus sp. BJ-4]|nr:winged helix-turn-helix transcriptional regulator [Paenibacillus sp. BJ-4]